MNILEQELLPHIRDWCEHFNFSPFDFKIYGKLLYMF